MQCQPRGWVKGCRLSVCRGDLGQYNLSCCPPSATQVLFCLDLSPESIPIRDSCLAQDPNPLQDVQGSRQEGEGLAAMEPNLT